MTNARIYVTCIKTLATELILKEVFKNVSIKDIQAVYKTIRFDVLRVFHSYLRTLK